MDIDSYQFLFRPTIFRYSAFMQAILVLSIVGMLFGAIFLLLLGQQSIWLLIPLPLILGYLAWELIRRTGSVTIDAEGVRRSGLLGSEKFIRWADLTVRNDWTRRHLVLRDSLGDHKIVLENELGNFSQAVEMVRHRRADLFQAELRQAAGPFGVASFNLVSIVLLVIPFLLVTFLGVILLVYFFAEMPSLEDSMPPYIMWLTFFASVMTAGVPLVFLLLQPLSMRLGRKVLEVRYLTGKQRFLANDIQDIRLEVVSAGKGGLQIQISIIPRQGKTLRMRGPSSGGPWLYCVLKTWWEGQKR
ncbi:MAG: hypothetical protein AB1894_15965 [Chloroflexota bacterium]